MYIPSNPWPFAHWIGISWCAFVKTPWNTLGTRLRRRLPRVWEPSSHVHVFTTYSLISSSHQLPLPHLMTFHIFHSTSKSVTKVPCWRRIGDSAFQILEGMKPWSIVGAISTAMVRPRCLLQIYVVDTGNMNVDGRRCSLWSTPKRCFGHVWKGRDEPRHGSYTRIWKPLRQACS